MPRRLDPTVLHAVTPPAFDKGKLHRADLVDRIHASLEKSLVVVAAPAGYGKTTLLSDFTAHTDTKVCWVRLGDDVTDAVTLAQLIALSVQQGFRRASRSELPRFSPDSTPVSIARILSAWVEDKTLDSFCLVIDEVHTVGSQASSIQFLDELIRLRPNSMTVIACGRSVPELSLARLLAEGQLAGFGPHDLALTRSEVEALSERLWGRPARGKEVEELYDVSKGWVTGVVLSGSVARQAIGNVSPESSPLVYDYLSSVVLNRLPDDLRRFALDASVLPVMTSDLCNNLLERDDSARMLKELLRRGAFIDVSDGDVSLYSFHTLFRAFLVDTLGASEEPRLSRLRSKGGGLLESQGSIEAAFQLYLEANDPVRCAKLADRHAKDLVNRGRVETLSLWWKSLRDSGVVAHELVLQLATAYLDRGEVGRAEELLSEIEGRPTPRALRHIRPRTMNLRAGILLSRSDYEGSLRLAERVIRTRDISKKPGALAIALETKAAALVARRIHLRDARKAAERATAILSETSDSHGLARALQNLGTVLEAQGEHRELGAIVARATSLLREIGSPTENAYALNNLATIRHKEGRFDEALATYGEALKSAREAAHPFLEALVLFGQADVFNDVGMALQAAQLYGEGLSIAARVESRQLVEYGCLQTAVMYRRRGNIAVSHEWIRRVVEEEIPGSRNKATDVQLAALEALASPRNSVASLRRILRTSDEGLRIDEEILAKLFLAHSYHSLNQEERCHQLLEDVLSDGSARGVEQVIAAELRSNVKLTGLVESMPPSAAKDVVLARLEALESFRRLHGVNLAETSHRKSLRITALGAERITFDGRPIRGLKRQAREVLYFLADRKAASREILSDVFWPEHPPGRRIANIHTTIHSIRAAMGRESVLLEDKVYTLSQDLAVGYDVDHFERAAGIALKLLPGDPRRFFALTEAVGLYTGPFLQELGTPWIVERRRYLEVRYLDLVADLASEALIRDQPQRALEYLRRGLSIDPLRDDFNLRYLEALGRLGQISEASQHYHRYTQMIRDELGIDPPSTIRDLYSRLLG